MTHLYQNYIWKDGIPLGIQMLTEGEGYKIIADPYHKRISIEKHKDNQFVETLYDSVFLDFRHLKPAEQTAWERLIIEEKEDRLVCLIKNQDDRVLFKEHYTYQDGICRICEVCSPQGIYLSTHRMYYTALNDAFDGVVLFDANAHPVMLKRYACDPETLSFNELIEENWRIEPGTSLL